MAIFNSYVKLPEGIFDSHCWGPHFHRPEIFATQGTQGTVGRPSSLSSGSGRSEAWAQGRWFLSLMLYPIAI